MKKKLKVHILPTEDKSHIHNLKHGYLTYQEELSFKPKSCIPSVVGKNQHLYFTSNEEIEEGDNVFNIDNNIIFIIHKHDLPVKNTANRKIIATTDSKLINETKCSNCRGYGHTDRDGFYKCDCCQNGRNYDLPQPSQSFIKLFCEKNGIWEVEVEYYPKSTIKGISTYLPKTTEDNTIVISEAEEKMYSESFVLWYSGMDKQKVENAHKRWIKENL